MQSMTGYGKADLKNKNIGISVEISSVNNRFLEFGFRLPKQISFLEPKFKGLIGSKVSRGKVILAINYEDYGIGIDKLVVSLTLADELNRRASELKKKYNLAGEIEVGHLLTFPDVFKVEKSEEIEEKIWPFMKTVVNRALGDLVAMRKREGANLKADMIERLKLLEDGIKKVGEQCPDNVAAYREKLSQKLAEVLSTNIPDEARLEEEIAYLAERCDITEECVRFISHIKQFRASLRKSGPIGKRLNFLLQELNREANTIGAKASNTKISHLVVELKEEIEKMREQVQNIE
ncbi:MAG: YicC family protein [Candidatus Zixiibacteriota bacterium]|nr:MAG: YicC family protein [candidate division Zixibacteria bacterium]